MTRRGTVLAPGAVTPPARAAAPGPPPLPLHAARGAAMGKILAVLSALPSHDRPTRIARAAGLDYATTKHLLRQLVTAGWVRHIGRGEYAPGPALIAVARKVAELAPDEAVDRWQLRAQATGGGPCGRCGSPYFTHVCLSCSPDAQTPGPGCINCRDTGMDQTPCLPPAGATR